jgi:SAM-dependent methyltransferase
MRAVDRYTLRVLSDEWAAQGPAPSLLDISRAGARLGPELRAAGFRVTRITLQDGSLASLGERLTGVMETFDAICCRDVLELADDWTEVVGRLARRLRPGGILLYSVGAASVTRGPLARLVHHWFGSGADPDRLPSRRRALPVVDLIAALRPLGLLPRELTALGGSAGAARAGWDAYMGYSVRRTERPAPAAGMRWKFTGTGERWIAGSRQTW